MLVDKIRIGQVIVRNAIEAMESVDDRNLTISNSDGIEIRIADTDPRASQLVKERMFRPLVTTKDKEWVLDFRTQTGNRPATG